MWAKVFIVIFLYITFVGKSFRFLSNLSKCAEVMLVQRLNKYIFNASLLRPLLSV